MNKSECIRQFNDKHYGKKWDKINNDILFAPKGSLLKCEQSLYDILTSHDLTTVSDNNLLDAQNTLRNIEIPDLSENDDLRVQIDNRLQSIEDALRKKLSAG